MRSGEADSKAPGPRTIVRVSLPGQEQSPPGAVAWEEGSAWESVLHLCYYLHSVESGS